MRKPAFVSGREQDARDAAAATERRRAEEDAAEEAAEDVERARAAAAEAAALAAKEAQLEVLSTARTVHGCVLALVAHLHCSPD